MADSMDDSIHDHPVGLFIGRLGDRSPGDQNRWATGRPPSYIKHV